MSASRKSTSAILTMFKTHCLGAFDISMEFKNADPHEQLKSVRVFDEVDDTHGTYHETILTVTSGENTMKRMDNTSRQKTHVSLNDKVNEEIPWADDKTQCKDVTKFFKTHDIQDKTALTLMCHPHDIESQLEKIARIIPTDYESKLIAKSKK